MTNPHLGTRVPSTEAKFYVYVHSRLSNGEPFYVGKGAGDRALHPTNRSEHWKRIVAKDGGRYLSYIARDLDEDFALLLECEVIDKYRRVGVKLINQTNGGDGISGYRWAYKKRGGIMSPEGRARVSAASKGKKRGPHTDEWKRKISSAMMGNKNSLGIRPSAETRKKLSAVHKGKQHTLGHTLTEDHKAKVSAGLRAFYAKRRAEK